MVERFADRVTVAGDALAVELVNVSGRPNERARKVGGNTCGSCDPPMPDTLYVTWGGLTGSLAFGNGTWAVQWLGDEGNSLSQPFLLCRWQAIIGQVSGRDYLMDVRSPGDSSESAMWICLAQILPGAQPCAKSKKTAVVEPCDPDQTYTNHECFPGGCPGTTVCAAMVGATVTVSVTPPP